MKDAVGAFNEIVILNKTSTYPWFIDYDMSWVKIVQNEDDPNETRTQIHCAVFRDFITDWSEIEIKVGDTLKAITGYRMYSTDTSQIPYAKGNSDRFEMQVLEGTTSGLFYSAVAAFLVVSEVF